MANRSAGIIAWAGFLFRPFWRRPRPQGLEHAWLAALVEGSNDAIIGLDLHGRVTNWNRAAERMFGYAAEEAIGQSVRDLIVPVGDQAEEAEEADFLARVACGEIVPTFDSRRRASDGHLIDVSITVSSIREAKGRVSGVSQTLRDISQNVAIGRALEESRASLASAVQTAGRITALNAALEHRVAARTEELRASERFLRGITEHSPAMVGYWDAHLRCRFANESYGLWFGKSAAGMLGACYHDLQGGYFSRLNEAHIRGVLRGEAQSFERQITRTDGTDGHLWCHYIPDIQDGVVCGYYAFSSDITELKEAQNALGVLNQALEDRTREAEAATLAKSQFLANMSHEIRTPMNAIIGVADLLAMTSLNSEQDEYVRMFRRSGRRLLNLVNEILDLSKIEAAQIDIEHDYFSLYECLEGLVELLTPTANDKGLSLFCQIAPDVPNIIVGDMARLEQVLVNLIGNAIKFTQTGAVSLRVLRVPGDSTLATLEFVVSDTGIGIAPDMLEAVFERFNQGEASATRPFGGSGLGLTISKQLAELMGGRISCASELGQGSVFTFTALFEARAAAAAPTAPPAAHPSPDLAPKPLRILTVDDSRDNRALIIAYLKNTPYQSDLAATGAIGCEMFATGRYDLVLMDRQMPVMDGLTATRAMRTWEKTSGRRATPIIALTAAAMKGDREACLAAGCTAYLAKPIEREALLRAISQYASA